MSSPIVTEVAASWADAKELIWRLVADFNIITEFGSANALNVERILLEHVPLEKRFMTERWLNALRRIDEHIDELLALSIDMEDPVSNVETMPSIVPGAGSGSDRRNDTHVPRGETDKAQFRDPITIKLQENFPQVQGERNLQTRDLAAKVAGFKQQTRERNANHVTLAS
jgi:hypothetical protein